MADTITEFINVTGRTYDQMVAGVTIASNTANEQAVIKDVYVNNSVGKAMRLNVGSALVAAVPSSQNARLTGAELLGASSTMSLSTTVQGLLNQIVFSPQETTTISSVACSTVFTGDSISGTLQFAASPNVIISPAFSVTPRFMCFANNGDFYYSDNGTGSLFRRQGGVNGTQTTISTSGAACSFDGRFIFSFASGGTNMTVTDTQNNGSVTNGTVTNLPQIVNTTANSASIDGVVFVQPSQSDFVWMVNPATRVATNLNVLQGSNAAKNYLGIGRRDDGDYILLRAHDSNQYFEFANIGPTLLSPSVKTYSSITASLSASAGVVNNLYRVVAAPRYLFNMVANGSNNFLIDVQTLTASVFSYTNITVALNAAKSLTPLAARTSADFGLTSVRATGVKTTP